METVTNKTLEKLKYDLVRAGLVQYEVIEQAEEISTIHWAYKLQNKKCRQLCNGRADSTERQGSREAAADHETSRGTQSEVRS